jgi:hypothetical protein
MDLHLYELEIVNGWKYILCSLNIHMPFNYEQSIPLSSYNFYKKLINITTVTVILQCHDH